MADSEMKIAHVVIAKRQPRGHDYYDYEIPSKLVGHVYVGSLVKIPWRNSWANGVVIEVVATSSFSSLKSISEVIIARAVTPQQILLWNKVSDYYGVAKGSVLNSFIPINLGKKYKFELPTPKSTSNSPEKSLIFHNDTAVLVKILKKIYSQTKDRDQLLLVLVPDVQTVLKISSFFPNSSTWHTSQTPSDARSVFTKITQGKINILIATRAALFLPFVNLGGIVTTFTESENYKQYDLNPRYDGIEVAKWLSEIYNCSLALISSSPRLIDWFQFTNGGFKMINYKKNNATNIVIQDLAGEPTSKDIPLLSNKLFSQLLTNIQQNKKTFIYFNRTGSYKIVRCVDCGNIYKCDVCKQPLGIKNGTQLYCEICKTNSQNQSNCTTCGGVKQKYQGVGIDQIIKSLQENLPVDRVTKVDKINQPLSLVNVGTSSAIHALTWSTVEDVIVLSADSDLFIPEFRSEEIFINRLHNLVCAKPKNLFIQTFNLEHNLFKNNLLDISAIGNYLMEQRRSFKWPPYFKIVRLIIKGGVEANVLSKCVKIFDLLNTVQGLIVSRPYISWEKKGKNFTYYILVRFVDEKLMSNIYSHLTEDVLIDRDPYFTLS